MAPLYIPILITNTECRGELWILVKVNSLQIIL
uniref:Uncharacterized protein n=1 Tax=Anguilla anguilla TaxID=7936 RepID=A0A0E9PK87_ANGAN